MSIFATDTNKLTFCSHAGLIWQYLTKLISVLNAHWKTHGINNSMSICKTQTCVERIYNIINTRLLAIGYVWAVLTKLLNSWGGGGGVEVDACGR